MPRPPPEGYVAGAPVMHADPDEGWAEGHIASVRGAGEAALVTVSPAMREFTTDQVVQLDDSPTGLPADDLADITTLHEATVLREVKSAFESGKCLLRVSADAVLSINPYTSDLPGGGLYSLERLHPPASADTLHDRQAREAEAEKHLRAHPCGLAREALGRAAASQGFAESRSSTIVVTGESGSGKTECTKGLLNYILRHCEVEGGGAAPSSGSPSAPDLASRIAAAGDVLEVLGNAKTLRNDNSSRFGRLLSLYFAGPAQPGGTEGAAGGAAAAPPRPVLLGAAVDTFLFEFSRVVRHAATDRNFHVFYAMVKGADAGAKQALFGRGALRAQEFACLTPGSSNLARGVSDTGNWLRFTAGLEALGAGPLQVREGVMPILAAVMNLSNVTFLESPAHPSASANAAPHAEIDTAGWDALQLAASNLGVPPPILEALLVQSTVRDKASASPKAVITVRHTVAKAESMRSGLQQHLYASLVRHITRLITAQLGGAAAGRRGGASGGGAEGRIALLDLFGYEDCRDTRGGRCKGENYFEQFLINFANEKIQSIYVDSVFKNLEERLVRDGVGFRDDAIPRYEDNTGCVDLIADERKGLLRSLEDECILSMQRYTTDAMYYEKLTAAFVGPQQQRLNPFFSIPRVRAQRAQQGVEAVPIHFTVSHYAGDVTYNVDGFIEKNKAPLREEARATLASRASQPEVKEILSGASGGETLNSKKFRESLKELTAVLEDGAVLFVRCVKPNAQKRAGVFEGALVLSQLVSNAVLPSVMLEKASPRGVSHRLFALRHRPVLYARRNVVALQPSSRIRTFIDMCRDIRRRVIALQAASGKRKYAGHPLEEALQVGTHDSVYMLPGVGDVLRVLTQEGERAAAGVVSKVFVGYRARRKVAQRRCLREAAVMQAAARQKAEAAAAARRAVDAERRRQEAGQAAQRAAAAKKLARRVEVTRGIEADRAMYAYKAHKQLDLLVRYITNHDREWDAHEQGWLEEELTRQEVEEAVRKRRIAEHEARMKAIHTRSIEKEQQRAAREDEVLRQKREAERRRTEKARAQAAKRYEQELRQKEQAAVQEQRGRFRNMRRADEEAASIASLRRREASLDKDTAKRKKTELLELSALSIRRDRKAAQSQGLAESASFDVQRATWQREEFHSALLFMERESNHVCSFNDISRTASPSPRPSPSVLPYTDVVHADVVRGLQRVS